MWGRHRATFELRGMLERAEISVLVQPQGPAFKFLLTFRWRFCMLSLFSVFFSSDFFLQCQVVARASAHDSSADLSSSAAFPLHFLITEDVKKWTESIESGCSSGVAKRKAMQSNHMLASLCGCRLISLLCCSFCFKVNPLTHTHTNTHHPLTPHTAPLHPHTAALGFAESC